MDAPTRAALLREIDGGIERAQTNEAEAEEAVKKFAAEATSLRSFREWVLAQPVETNGSAPSAQVERAEPLRASPFRQAKHDTRHFIKRAFAIGGEGAGLQIQEITSNARQAGWTTVSKEPENVIRTVVGRMLASGELVEVEGPGVKRFRLSKEDSS